MQSIYIPKSKQEQLAAYVFMPEKECEYIIIICHGFRGAKENGGRIFAFAERLNSIGLGVVAFDFSGSGMSTGDFADITLSSQAADLEQVIDYVEECYNKPVILLGRSFGGSTVLVKGGTHDKRVKGYIFWCAPVKMYETFSSIVGSFSKDDRVLKIDDDAGSFMLKSTFLEDFAYHNMTDYAGKIGPCPVLIIHGASDELVDPENALFLYKNCSNAELHIISGADHRFTDNIAEREDITLNWLRRNYT